MSSAPSTNEKQQQQQQGKNKLLQMEVTRLKKAIQDLQSTRRQSDRKMVDYETEIKRLTQILKQKQDKQAKTATLGEKSSDLQQLQRIMRRGCQLTQQKQKNLSLTPEKENELNEINKFIDQHEQKIFTLGPIEKWTRLKMGLYRNQVHNKPFPNNYYDFLNKYMMDPRVKTPLDVIQRFYAQNVQGLAYEAMWSILINLGFCEAFPPEKYDFYEAELKKESAHTDVYFYQRILTNNEYFRYYRHSQIKGPNGKSDITLREKKDGKWVFISCKYYKKDKDKAATNYDVQFIQASIDKTNKEFPTLIGENNYEIYVFANDGKEVSNKFSKRSNIKVKGMDELEQCFTKFIGVRNQMQRDDFEKVYIKRKDLIVSWRERLTQNALVTKTIEIIQLKETECRLDRQNNVKNLKIFWMTHSGFGKTYCVGWLLKEYLRRFRSRPEFSFNTLIIVNSMDMMGKYASDVIGGHTEFIDKFSITEIRDIKKDIDKDRLRNLSDTANNIVILLKKDLALLHENTRMNFRFIVFDKFDGGDCESLFRNVKASPNKIGVFLATPYNLSRRTPNKCEYVLQWTEADNKNLQIVSQRLKHDPSKSIALTEQQLARITRNGTHSLEPFITRYFKHTKIQDSTRLQEIETCVRKLDLYVVSNYFKDPYTEKYMDVFTLLGDRKYSKTIKLNLEAFANKGKVAELLDRVKKALNTISSKKDDSSFKTQLWILPKAEKKMRQHLRDVLVNDEYFNNVDVIVLGEKDRTPPHFGTSGARDFHQSRTKSKRRKGIIYLIDSEQELAGQLRNKDPDDVDIVFLLNDNHAITPTSLITMCSKDSHQHRKTAFVVDFNAEHAIKFVYKYYGNSQQLIDENLKNIFDYNLVHFLDVDNPAEVVSFANVVEILKKMPDMKTQEQQLINRRLLQEQAKKKRELQSKTTLEEEQEDDDEEEQLLGRRTAKQQQLGGGAAASMTLLDTGKLKENINTTIRRIDRENKNPTSSQKCLQTRKTKLKEDYKIFNQSYLRLKSLNKLSAKEDMDIKKKMKSKLNSTWDQTRKQWVKQQSSTSTTS